MESNKQAPVNQSEQSQPRSNQSRWQKYQPQRSQQRRQNPPLPKKPPKYQQRQHERPARFPSPKPIQNQSEQLQKQQKQNQQQPQQHQRQGQGFLAHLFQAKALQDENEEDKEVGSSRGSFDSRVGKEHIESGRREVGLLQSLRESRFFKPVVFLFVFAVLASAGYLVYDLVHIPQYQCPSVGESSREVRLGRTIRISPSADGQVCLLQGETVLGRSYNGSWWQESIISPSGFSCSSDGLCTVEVPNDMGNFRLTTYNTIKAKTDLEEVSRFLIQATFGPTRAEIESWGSNSFKDWIIEQINLPPSLHREYYRKRVSPRVRATSPPGRRRGPCETMSRWHRFAFTKEDIGKTLVIKSIEESSNVMLEVNSIPRAEVPAAEWSTTGSSPFKICEVEEVVGGAIKFGGDCKQRKQNPSINFASPPSGRVLTLPESAKMSPLAAPISDVRVLELTSGKELPTCPVPAYGPVFVRNPANGLYFKHDRRLVLAENSLDSPANGEGADGEFCVQAPKTFLNRENCVVGGLSCSPARYSNLVEITLHQSNIRNFYTQGGHFVYRIDGLRLDGVRSPCHESSRWIKVSCAEGIDNAKLKPSTLALLANLLTESDDPNPGIRDIKRPDRGVPCDTSNTVGATLQVTGTCWKHVHPDFHNVYDFSTWTEPRVHPGNAEAVKKKRWNPIMKGAEVDGKSSISFPDGHNMRYWRDSRRAHALLGRFLDVVAFDKLPARVRSIQMESFFGLVKSDSDENRYTERCGSPGEVANDPSLGARFNMLRVHHHDAFDRSSASIDAEMFIKHSKTSTFTMNALYAVDQLRQRMAFALSQILVITEQQVVSDENEMYLTYYDIFVRHALGNFGDVLKEVSYSPLMADMLTFLETKSFEYSLRRSRREIFPDENYAREIMQLFSIGLLKLNMDGTVQTDSDGVPLETYSNEDIMGFSRAWTGFSRQKARGNVESRQVSNAPNRIDPMRIIPEYRDQFPKMDLYRGHIGDGYPLCIHLPRRMFLRKSATWIYLGKRALPTKVKDPLWFESGNDKVKRVVLNRRSSALYKALCLADRNGKCRFASHLELTENLPCHGIECSVDSVRVVEVDDAFYEYVQPACIEFPFFNNGKKIQHANGRNAMCAHPESIVASEACCESGELLASQNCLYHGERMTLSTASSRCKAIDREACDFRSGVHGGCFNDMYFWTTSGCEVNLKVSSDNGKVAVVHEPALGPGKGNTKEYMANHVKRDTRNWFRVNWVNGNYPSPQNNCQAVCQVLDDACLCKVEVTERAVFDKMPSRQQVVDFLHVGSLAPDVFDDGIYTVIPGSTGDVEAYKHADGAAFDDRTIFKVEELGETRYYVNMESLVELSNGAKFRNPSNLMGLAEATVRDAEHETDAVIDHFFKHPNCAPFIAYRIIQRFVTSNPSPRYVRACAMAFTQGSFEGIGSGKYGDLSALIAAVLLHEEARTVLLDADPTHGQMREPLLKVLHVLRSLDVEPRGNRELELKNLQYSIGEMAHYAPDVFSFFKPEYSPSGPLGRAGLAGPEAQVFTGPKVVAMLNGLISLTRFGLTDCYEGFGEHRERHYCNLIKDGVVGHADEVPGVLRWIPRGTSAEEIVDELSLLLTARRVDESARRWIVQEFETHAAANGRREAIVVAKQLLITAPEFHISNRIHRMAGMERRDDEMGNGTRPFKAVVFLMLAGGMDSFNLIVPHSECKGGKDMYQEYRDVRTDIALPKEDLLEITVPSGQQVCSRFGIHPNLPRVRQLYNQRDALFMANIGPLVVPLTKQDIINRAKPLPESLYAHNIQQQAAQTLSPQKRTPVGVLGRINNALHEQGFSVGSFSISGNNFALQGAPGKSPDQDFITRSGVSGFNPSGSSERVSRAIQELNKDVVQSFYGETWTATVSKTMERSDVLAEVLESTKLEKVWGSTTRLGNQLQQISKLIKARGSLGTDRQSFYTAMGGFDSHSNVGSDLVKRFTEIDDAIASFEEEMKLQGLWDDVVLVVSSDFARTITSNGAGTDHGWGGNYFMIGGMVKGGNIYGEYPQDLSRAGKENLGRGRLMPTTSWNAVWNGVAMWLGVEESRMDTVLPNRASFVNKLFSQNDLFGTDDPDSAFRNWLVILTSSIAVAALGLILILSMGKKRGGLLPQSNAQNPTTLTSQGSNDDSQMKQRGKQKSWFRIKSGRKGESKKPDL